MIALIAISVNGLSLPQLADSNIPMETLYHARHIFGVRQLNRFIDSSSFHRFSCFSVQVPTLQQQICTIAIARFIWWWDYMYTLNLYILINIYINAWEKRRPMKPHIKWVVFSFRCKYINSYIVWIHKVFIQYNTIIMNFYQKLLFLPQNEQKSRCLFEQMKLKNN